MRFSCMITEEADKLRWELIREMKSFGIECDIHADLKEVQKVYEQNIRAAKNKFLNGEYRRTEKKKVLWFSRHEMSNEQLSDLERIFGQVEINQVNKTVQTAFELKEEIEAADVVAIVAPINMQQQFLKLAGNRPVITATSERILKKQADGSEDKVVFQFKNWLKLIKIEVVTEVL